MTELMQAHRQWASRPDDQRFLSIPALHSFNVEKRQNSKEMVISSRALKVVPDADHQGITLTRDNQSRYAPTHWAFGQLAARAGAPADYLRTLPAELVADNLNWGLQYQRDGQDIGVMLRRDGEVTVNAVTGPRYGRIWDETITRTIQDRVDLARWKVPGEFGRPVPITKQNTTLYASDRDMWLFLADETNLIEVPGGGRNNATDALARGFFAWNSEVGSQTFGLATFLYRYVCQNRIIWGAREYREIRLRHTASAPDKMLEQALPALRSYAEGATAPLIQLLADARQKRLDDPLDFLSGRFGKRLAPEMMKAHLQDEGRPVETLWDAANAVTAHARTINHQDARVALESEGGKLLDLAA